MFSAMQVLAYAACFTLAPWMALFSIAGLSVALEKHGTNVSDWAFVSYVSILTVAQWGLLLFLLFSTR